MAKLFQGILIKHGAIEFLSPDEKRMDLNEMHV
jgi:hypothetical protein